MSYLTWISPNQNNSIKNIFYDLSPELKIKFNNFILCCEKSKIYYPTDIKKIIMIFLFSDKIIDPEDIFNWWTDYLNSTIQIINNPLYFNDFTQEIDISYKIISHELSNKELIISGFLNVLLFGIISDNRITSIILSFWINGVKIRRSEFLESKIKIKKLNKIEYLNILVIKKIFPLYFVGINFPIRIIIESTEKIDKLDLLWGFGHPKLQIYLNKNFKYYTYLEKIQFLIQNYKYI